MNLVIKIKAKDKIEAYRIVSHLLPCYEVEEISLDAKKEKVTKNFNLTEFFKENNLSQI